METASQHSLHKSELIPGVSLTCVKTDKFKSGCITINLLCKLSRDTASANAILSRVLRRGCASYPDMDKIAAVLDDLYGVRIEPLLRKNGELQATGFYIDFPDDRFIPDTEGILEKAVSVAGEMLLAPDTQGKLLRKDYIDSEKSNLIDDIRASINDKRGYSIDRLLEEMCANEPFGVNKLGSESEALAITQESLTAHYRNLIENTRIELLYCGTAEPERVYDALKPALSGLSKRSNTIIPKTDIVLDPVTDPPRRFTETLDVSQGKLTVGFRMGKAMNNPDYPALMVFNALYGGCVTSKLFLNVRERLSLCYYASSMLDKHKGVMIVASGVEFSEFNTALDEILVQLDNVKRGDISDWEMTSAKRSVTTSLKSALDRQGGLEELYFDSAISAVPYDPIKLSDMVMDVTPQQVADAAAGIKPDSVYLLSGKEGHSCEA